MTTITWSVAMLERSNDNDKVVNIAHYRVDGVDGDDTAGAYGTMNFEGDASADGFIAFDSLTEADVIGWVKAEFGDEKVAEIEAAINAQIAEKQNPTSVAEVPWAASEG